MTAAMRSAAGVCVPLTCGHNAAWGPVEEGLVGRLLRAAIYGDA
jgi:hypothetical protein